MPLPSPWTKPSPPSPLQRITAPLSLRTRNKTRLALTLLATILLFCALNELRCLKSPCTTRVPFTSSHPRPGGAVLPDEWTYRLGSHLKANTPAPEPPDGKEKQKVPVPDGALIEPDWVWRTENPHESAGEGRWIEHSTYYPVAPSAGTSAQMEADWKTYVDGEAPPAKINAPATEADPDPAAGGPEGKTSADSPHVEHGGAGHTSAVNETQGEAEHASKSHAASPTKPSPPTASAHDSPHDSTSDSPSFGSMEMGLLMGGG